jgi:hypothetical protein
MNYVACCRQPGAWLKRHSRSRVTAAFARLTPSRHPDSAPRAHGRVRVCGPPPGGHSDRYQGRRRVRLRSQCKSQTSPAANLFPRAHLYTDTFSQGTTSSPDRQRARTAAKVRQRAWRRGRAALWVRAPSCSRGPPRIPPCCEPFRELHVAGVVRPKAEVRRPLVPDPVGK